MNKLNAAEDVNASAEVLEKLAEDSSFFVRFRVANNPNASSQTLEKLAGEFHYGINCAVAENASITEKAIIILIDKGNEDIIRKLYRNEAISKKLKNMIFILTGLEREG